MTAKTTRVLCFVTCVLFACCMAIGSQYLPCFAQNERLKIDILYGNSIFRYIDHTVTPTNYVMQLDFLDRGINAEIPKKIELLRERRQLGYSKKECINHYFPLFENTVQRVNRSVSFQPTDSTISFHPNRKPMFVITREREGRQLDIDRLYEDFFDAVVAGKRQVRAVADTVEPTLTAEQNAKATFLRARFSTDFSRSIDSRKHNIRLALSKLSGKRIESGAEFSFNKTVGARTAAKGFLEAKIIVGGQFVDGVGGGVCQVSTTMYNTALRADMAITTVRNHSLPVSYVPPSFDAMVNSGTSDLKWANGTTQPVFIKAYATANDQAVIEIYGQAMTYNIFTESEIVEQLPPPSGDTQMIDHEHKYTKPTDPSGTAVRVSEPRGGLISKGFLVFVDFDNRVIARRQIRTDKYTPQKGLIAVAP